MRATLRLLALLGLVAALGCGTPAIAPIPPCDGDDCEVTGRVVWMNLEGGFFAIRGDDQVTYDAHDLPAAFRQDGLRVAAILRPRLDVVCIHMAGTIVDVVTIRRL